MASKLWLLSEKKSWSMGQDRVLSFLVDFHSMLHVAFFLSLALQSAFWWNFHSCLAVLLIFPHTTGWPGASAFAWEIPTLNPPRFTKFQPGKCREKTLPKTGPLNNRGPINTPYGIWVPIPLLKGSNRGPLNSGRGPTIPTKSHTRQRGNETSLQQCRFHRLLRRWRRECPAHSLGFFLGGEQWDVPKNRDIKCMYHVCTYTYMYM